MLLSYIFQGQPSLSQLCFVSQSLFLCIENKFSNINVTSEVVIVANSSFQSVAPGQKGLSIWMDRKVRGFIRQLKSDACASDMGGKGQRHDRKRWNGILSFRILHDAVQGWMRGMCLSQSTAPRTVSHPSQLVLSSVSSEPSTINVLKKWMNDWMACRDFLAGFHKIFYFQTYFLKQPQSTHQMPSSARSRHAINSLLYSPPVIPSKNSLKDSASGRPL